MPFWTIAAINAVLSTNQVQHASPDDCEIIAAVAKADLRWESSKSAPIITAISQSDGSKYIEDCPWRDYGVASPKITAPGTSGITIFPPYYGPDHLTAVVSTAEDTYYSGSPVPLSAVAETKLKKMNGHWKIVPDF